MDISNIDIDKSISKNTLCYYNSMNNFWRSFYVYFILIFILSFSILLYSVFYKTNTEHNIFYPTAIIVLLVIFLFYVLIRKWTEKKLTIIYTPYALKRNKKILLDFAKENLYTVSRSGENNFIRIDTSNSKHHFFFLLDKEVRFCTLSSVDTESGHIYFPSLLTHWMVNSRLKRYFKNKKI